MAILVSSGRRYDNHNKNLMMEPEMSTTHKNSPNCLQDEEK